MAATPTPNRRLGFSVAPTPPSLIYTPRLERRNLDLRWADGNSTSHKHDRDREVPVQVVLRCRLAFFKAAYALYDSDFYVKADDDIYLRPVIDLIVSFCNLCSYALFLLLSADLEGLAMIDDGHRDGRRRYWFPCVASISTTSGLEDEYAEGGRGAAALFSPEKIISENSIA
ncbi:kinesin-related protein [Carex littledalei]|uniref:Kinesin-related protein n=1 Tax=Carex littledalei TaxID=544730 RepID=A0A833VSP0_9POAL|nr:kinesin-related protein [Carex littledalei]